MIALFELLKYNETLGSPVQLGSLTVISSSIIHTCILKLHIIITRCVFLKLTASNAPSANSPLPTLDPKPQATDLSTSGNTGLGNAYGKCVYDAEEPTNNTCI